MLEDLENITRFQSTSQRRSIIQRKPSMQPLPEKDDSDSINSVSLEATDVATGEQNEEKVNLNIRFKLQLMEPNIYLFLSVSRLAHA